MTASEFKEKAKIIEIEYMNQYNEAKKKWDNGEEVNAHFLTRKYIRSEEFIDRAETPTAMRKLLDEFEEEIRELPRHVNGFFELELSASYDEIYNNYYSYYYYVMIDERTIELNINNEKRYLISETLKPENYSGYAKKPDCKLMELYLDEVIDFDTLKRLTYSDCEV